jgi:hypothetical protein
MNRVNPIYVVVVLVVIVVFMMFQLHNEKEYLQEVKSEYKEVKVLANELGGLKAVYANPKKSKKLFQKLLRASVLRSVNIKSDFTKKGVKITAESIDRKALNYLMGKVLNATYKVKALKIEKLSKTKASLYMEIQW